MSPAKRHAGPPGDSPPPPERLAFAANFKRARKAAGLTQEALRDKTGFAQSFISDVENARSTINIDNAALLARAVGVPLSKLFEPTRD
jgi:transcriptional regulator with XRE-family HTH domain